MVDFLEYTSILSYFNALFLKREDVISSFLENRDFSLESLRDFSLGYCENVLIDDLSSFDKESLDATKMFNNSLCIFEKRLTFPIKNSDGKIVSFCGRAVDINNFKYLNKPDSIYSLRDFNLYGIDLAIESILLRGYVYIVEGLFDVIRMHSIGFDNTVGIFGTHISNEQLLYLRCLTDSLVILLDGDSAGLIGAQEINNKAISAGFKTCVISLPDGHDPDSFICNYQKDVVFSTLSNVWKRF